MPSDEAVKKMATWVAAIADNVKNPIAAVGAVLDVVERHRHDPERVGHAIAQIRARLAQLDEYVSELAGFARPTALTLRTVPAAELLQAALAAAALPPSARVEVRVAPGLMLRVDEAKLSIALKAIVRNGFESVVAARTPHLIVAAESAERGVTITVDDNGAGLSGTAERHATEPFFTTKEAGTGLGLAIAKKYVVAHGGDLALDRSEALGGCRVTLTLPKTAALQERTS
jgi:C4-dicarboxylate-specific signal transduction histidine kinase